MTIFTKENITDTDFYSATPYVHDSLLKELRYEIEDNRLFLKMANDICKRITRFNFHNVRLFHMSNTNKWGESEEIIGISLQDSIESDEESRVKIECDIPEGYMLFNVELFSGNYMWIMCEEIAVDEYTM